MSVARALQPLEQFLARYPALAHLELVVPYARQGGPEPPWWRRLVKLLEQSSVRTCAIGPGYDQNTLERDDGGLLSRIRL